MEKKEPCGRSMDATGWKIGESAANQLLDFTSERLSCGVGLVWKRLGSTISGLLGYGFQVTVMPENSEKPSLSYRFSLTDSSWRTNLTAVIGL